jgi:regulator of chromosome condensation
MVSTVTEIQFLRDKKVTQITGGDCHTLARDVYGQVYSVGLNDYGQLGLGDDATRTTFVKMTNLPRQVQQMACGRYHSLVVDASRSLFAFGYNFSGQLV